MGIRIDVEVAQEVQRELRYEPAIVAYPGLGWFKERAKELAQDYLTTGRQGERQAFVNLGNGRRLVAFIHPRPTGVLVRFVEVVDSP